MSAHHPHFHAVREKNAKILPARTNVFIRAGQDSKELSLKPLAKVNV